MAAMYRINTASFGIWPNKNPANAIVFDVKVALLSVTALMTKNRVIQALD